MDKNANIVKRLFAWSFSVAVSAGPRWGDLLNSAPYTLDLMRGSPIGFAAKTKTREKSEGAILELVLLLIQKMAMAG